VSCIRLAGEACEEIGDRGCGIRGDVHL
jgi:hypothetical protein